MANFPGNPYATDSHFLSNDAAAITKAITLLAFEVRTANILAAAQVTMAADVATASGKVLPVTAELYTTLMDRVGERMGNPKP